MQDATSAEGKTRLPRGFPVVLLHDLVESCQVGDRVEVTGAILQQAQAPLPSNGAPPRPRVLTARTVYNDPRSPRKPHHGPRPVCVCFQYQPHLCHSHPWNTVEPAWKTQRNLSLRNPP